jgi:hypothetical protein
VRIDDLHRSMAGPEAAAGTQRRARTEALTSRARARPPTRSARSSRDSRIDLNAHANEQTSEQMRTFTAHTTATSAHPARSCNCSPIRTRSRAGRRSRSRSSSSTTSGFTPGAEVRVRGQLAGRSAEFSVHVLEVSDERLALVAQGPLPLDVEYQVAPACGGSAIRASVSVLGHGLIGRLLAKATEALLAAGALQSSLNRLVNQPQPAIAA